MNARQHAVLKAIIYEHEYSVLTLPNKILTVYILVNILEFHHTPSFLSPEGKWIEFEWKSHLMPLFPAVLPLILKGW